MKTYTIPKGTLARRYPQNGDGDWEDFRTTKTVVYTEYDAYLTDESQNIIFVLPKIAYPYTLLLVDKKDIQ